MLNRVLALQPPAKTLSPRYLGPDLLRAPPYINCGLQLPAAEVRAKRRALLRVRRHFFYHDDPDRPGAVQQLIYDMGTAVSTATKFVRREQLYRARILRGGLPGVTW